MDSVPYRARVSEAIVPGVVEANMGGGSPIAAEAWRRANVNELTEMDHRDPISGFPVYKTLLCDVVKRSSQSASYARHELQHSKDPVSESMN